MNENELRKHIGHVIKENRRKKNLTQGELGEKMDIDNSTVSAYERGVININLNTLYLLADIFEIKLDDFFPNRKESDALHNSLFNRTEDLTLEEMLYMKSLIEYVQTLDNGQRSNLISNIDLAVEFFKKNLKQ